MLATAGSFMQAWGGRAAAGCGPDHYKCQGGRMHYTFQVKYALQMSGGKMQEHLQM